MRHLQARMVETAASGVWQTWPREFPDGRSPRDGDRGQCSHGAGNEPRPFAVSSPPPSHTRPATWIPAFLNPSQCVGTSPSVSPTETEPSSTDTPHRANRPFHCHVLPALVYLRPALQHAPDPQALNVEPQCFFRLAASRIVNSNEEI